MNALLRFWTEEDRQVVGDMVEKLFLLNDRTLNIDKKAIFIKALERSGLPAYDVIRALDEMEGMNLKFIKLTDILDRARGVLTKEISEKPIEEYHIDEEERQYVLEMIGKCKNVYGKEWFKFFANEMGEE
jgi:hypothetical protein